MAEKMFTVGKVVNTQGIRGEIKVYPQTDFPEVRFAKDSELLMINPETNQTIPVKVERSREHKNMYVVKLEQFDNINDVEKYKGWILKVTEADLLELPDNEYYYFEIVGCRVVTDEGEELGTIKEILAPGANDVWVVKQPKGKELLIPVIDEVVLDVNVQEKLVTVHLMEGLV
ncbi:ribosome maturation factor RimM [Paenibacillus sp. 481]|uniref:ribosome maturation factor RimM n=1 Tax=Paenibacillus sp. 481 TaxID=2835869 RepID=UPI001E2859FA|nr:ribosome maturation factor RimM [Paenibacillus sp. 481]UHA73961.1 ribosome maturation factor RimM [Paenibacillus sp. 481]